MKQFITVEQLKEIDNLIEFIYKTDNWAHSKEYIKEKIDFPAFMNNRARSINIGRILEILGDDIKTMHKLKNHKRKWWVGVPVYRKGKEVIGEFHFLADELVDALWEAVKYKIEIEEEQKK